MSHSDEIEEKKTFENYLQNVVYKWSSYMSMIYVSWCFGVLMIKQENITA